MGRKIAVAEGEVEDVVVRTAKVGDVEVSTLGREIVSETPISMAA